LEFCFPILSNLAYAAFSDEVFTRTMLSQDANLPSGLVLPLFLSLTNLSRYAPKYQLTGEIFLSYAMSVGQVAVKLLNMLGYIVRRCCVLGLGPSPF
jgi:hypothetical protein